MVVWRQDNKGEETRGGRGRVRSGSAWARGQMGGGLVAAGEEGRTPRSPCSEALDACVLLALWIQLRLRPDDSGSSSDLSRSLTRERWASHTPVSCRCGSDPIFFFPRSRSAVVGQIGVGDFIAGISWRSRVAGLFATSDDFYRIVRGKAAEPVRGRARSS